MALAYDARNDRELAHALMAVLRLRYEIGLGGPLIRGLSPQPLTRAASPVASGALLDARTGRVVVAAEAIEPGASGTSIDAALDRVAPLIEFVRRGIADDAVHTPEIWMCVPAPEREALETSLAMPHLRWVPYDISGMDEMRRGSATELGGAPVDLERLLAKRDAIMRDHELASARQAQLHRDLRRAAARLEASARAAHEEMAERAAPRARKLRC